MEKVEKKKVVCFQQWKKNVVDPWFSHIWATFWKWLWEKNALFKEANFCPTSEGVPPKEFTDAGHIYYGIFHVTLDTNHWYSMVIFILNLHE